MPAPLSQSRCRVILLTALLVIPATVNGQGEMTVNAAVSVLDEVMSSPGKQIPQRLMHDARGIAIIPGVVKGGFVVGVRHGRGVMLVKDDAGSWHQPSFITMSGGSVGWQAGIQSTDVVLVFKTRSSVNNLMNGRLKIGVDAAAAAGPVGREATAATDATLSAEIYSYSRSRGLFAGVSFEGSGLQVDHLADRAYYRSDAAGNHTMLPESAVRLMNRVAQYSGAQAVGAAPSVSASPAAQPSAPSGTSQSEAVRQQLVASWNQLSQLLDDQWKSFTALPEGLVSGQQAVRREDLDAALQRYASIASNPQYASLAQRHEFATTYQLLREYVTLQSSQAQRLTLPPPPTVNNAGVSRGRY